jgi:RNA polymerase sigma-70 factor (ECF subfamily)
MPLASSLSPQPVVAAERRAPIVSTRPAFERAVQRTPLFAHDTQSLERGLVTLVPELRIRALRLSGNRATADDLVQDTIERALKFGAQYERGTNLRAWAYQILFSVFVTRYRRSRREKNALRNLSTDPSAWTLPCAFASPEVGASLTASTKSALDELPVGFRHVVTLVDLDERSYRDAATELGVPLGTVMSRLHRGRKMLAERLASSRTKEAA